MLLSIVPLLGTALVYASPTHRIGCDIHDAHLTLPSNQTLIVPPPDTLSPIHIAVGVGVQNYTCDAATQKYTSVGAVAELFDISCLSGNPLAFKNIQDVWFADWSRMPESFTVFDLVKENKGNRDVLGQHYFIQNGTAIAPKFDFTSASQKGNPDAYSVCAKVGDLPVSSSNVDWLSLKSVEGDLAAMVYRVDTRSGRPPASCVAGSPLLSVKYTAKYWFFGNSNDH